MTEKVDHCDQQCPIATFQEEMYNTMEEHIWNQKNSDWLDAMHKYEPVNLPMFASTNKRKSLT